MQHIHKMTELRIAGLAINTALPILKHLALQLESCFLKQSFNCFNSITHFCPSCDQEQITASYCDCEKDFNPNTDILDGIQLWTRPLNVVKIDVSHLIILLLLSVRSRELKWAQLQKANAGKEATIFWSWKLSRVFFCTIYFLTIDQPKPNKNSTFLTKRLCSSWKLNLHKDWIYEIFSWNVTIVFCNGKHQAI